MDNRYYKFGCPALMNDGRFLTNHLPKRTFDQIVRDINKIDSIQNYKLYLQNNAEFIIKTEFKILTELNTCKKKPACDFTVNDSQLFSCNCAN